MDQGERRTGGQEEPRGRTWRCTNFGTQNKKEPPSPLRWRRRGGKREKVKSIYVVPCQPRTTGSDFKPFNLQASWFYSICLWRQAVGTGSLIHCLGLKEELVLSAQEMRSDKESAIGPFIFYKMVRKSSRNPFCSQMTRDHWRASKGGCGMPFHYNVNVVAFPGDLPDFFFPMNSPGQLLVLFSWLEIKQ